MNESINVKDKYPRIDVPLDAINAKSIKNNDKTYEEGIIEGILFATSIFMEKVNHLSCFRELYEKAAVEIFGKYIDRKGQK